jgi:hypothetical protein
MVALVTTVVAALMVDSRVTADNRAMAEARVVTVVDTND